MYVRTVPIAIPNTALMTSSKSFVLATTVKSVAMNIVDANVYQITVIKGIFVMGANTAVKERMATHVNAITVRRAFILEMKMGILSFVATFRS